MKMKYNENIYLADGSFLQRSPKRFFHSAITNSHWQSNFICMNIIINRLEELWRLPFDRNDALASLEKMQHVSLVKKKL